MKYYDNTTNNAKNVLIQLTLTQYGKTIANESQLMKLGGTLYMNDNSYLTITNLSKYYNAATNQIILSVPMTEISYLALNDGSNSAIPFYFSLNNGTTSNTIATTQYAYNHHVKIQWD